MGKGRRLGPKATEGAAKQAWGGIGAEKARPGVLGTHLRKRVQGEGGDGAMPSGVRAGVFSSRSWTVISMIAWTSASCSRDWPGWVGATQTTAPNRASPLRVTLTQTMALTWRSLSLTCRSRDNAFYFCSSLDHSRDGHFNVSEIQQSFRALGISI